MKVWIYFVKDKQAYSDDGRNQSAEHRIGKSGEDSKVNIEALFNAVHLHKELIKGMFNEK